MGLVVVEEPALVEDLLCLPQLDPARGHRG
jgi:hypothetical protein